MKRKLIGSCILVAATLCVPLSTLNAAEPEELIKYRKNVMKIIGGHTGSLFAIAGEKAGMASHMEIHANGIAAASMMAKDLFPPESAEGDTRAAPEIWSDPEGFAERVAALEEAAAGVQTAVASNGDVGGALRDLGGSCKACHDDYRTD
jgi:cytochrome c556